MFSANNLPKPEAISGPTPAAAIDIDDALNWEFWKGDWPFWKHALSGSCAGVMEHIVMFPLDTIKTRVQAMKTSFLKAKNGNGFDSTFSGINPAMRSVTSNVDLIYKSFSCPNASADAPSTYARSSLSNFDAGKEACGSNSNSSFSKASTPSFNPLCNRAKSSPSCAFANETPVNASPFIVSEGAHNPVAGSSSPAATISKNSFNWSQGKILGNDWVRRRTYSFPLSSLRSLGTCIRSSACRGELVTAFNGLVSEGGFFRFFRGVSAITCGCIPAHASYFSVYEITKFRLGVGRNGYVSPISAALCGAAATFSHDVILTPMDMVKQRLQLGCYSGTIDCVKTVLRREGYSAFFRSMPTTVLMNIPFGSVAVSVNELMKSILRVTQSTGQSLSKEKATSTLIEKTAKEGTTGQATLGENVQRVSAASMPASALLQYFFCAGVGGGVAGVVSNPLDVVKTRLQTQDCEIQRELALRQLGNQSSISPVASMKYASFVSSMKLIWQEEGLLGFWRGTTARMALSIPATAVSWGTYEFVKYLLTELS